MWLESLVKICIDFFEAITFVFVIQEYEVACTTRLGKYDRTLDTGLHFKWPFVDRVHRTLGTIETTPLATQTVETKDEVSLVATPIISYFVDDPSLYFMRLRDDKDGIAGITAGSVFDVLTNLEWHTRDPHNSIDAEVQNQVKYRLGGFGITVKEIRFLDLAPIRSIRLIQSRPMEAEYE